MVIFPGPKKEASEALQAPVFPPKHLFIWWEWGAGGACWQIVLLFL